VKKDAPNWVDAKAKAQGWLVQQAAEAFRANTGLTSRRSPCQQNLALSRTGSCS